MKLVHSRLGKLLLAATGLVVTGALAVPLTMSLELRADSSPSFDRVTAARRLSIAWGEAPQSVAVPPVPGGYSPADYAAGSFYSSTCVKGVTEVGSDDVAISFFYPGVLGKRNMVVTYGMDVVKAEAAPLAVAIPNTNVAAGHSLPAFGFAQWLAERPQFAGYAAGVAGSPALTDEDGRSMPPANFDALPAGTIVTVRYTAVLDELHYNPNGQPVGFYEVTYKILPDGMPSAVSPSDTALPARRVEYGKFETAALLGPPDFVGAIGYDGFFLSAKVTAQSPIEDENSPAVGTVVDWDKVSTYNAGTSFLAVYEYLAGSNYLGAPFVTTQLFTITTQLVVTRADRTDPAGQMAYGSGVRNLLPPEADRGAQFALTSVRYYRDVAGTSTEQTEGQIDALDKNESFTVVRGYALNGPNYATASGKANSYEVTSPYVVTAGMAVYVSTKTDYEPEKSLLNEDAPADFLPADAPDPDKNTGYVFKSVTYALTRVPENSAFTVGPVADLADVKNYAAQTFVTATIVFTPNKNYTGPDIAFTKRLVVSRISDTLPLVYVFNPATYEFATTKPQPVAPTLGTGYDGSFRDVVVTIPAPGSSLRAGDTVPWASLGSVPVGTQLQVNFDYTPDPNHYGDDFTARGRLTIVKQRVVIPADSVATNEKSFTYGGLASSLTAPAPADATRFSLRGTPVYLAADGTNPLTAAQFAALKVGAKFTVRWTFGLKDTASYEPDSGTVDTYTVSESYAIVPANASYDSMNNSYAPVSRPYGTGFTDILPTALPDATAAKGYAYASVKYRITRASNDGTTLADVDINDLTASETYKAGTEVTATYTFAPASGYVGDDVLVTKVFTVTKKVLSAAPSDADLTGPNHELAYKTEQARPATGKTFEGYVGAYESAVVTGTGESGDPASNTRVDELPGGWGNFASFHAGTVVTAHFTFALDSANYESATKTLDYVETYTVIKKEVLAPTLEQVKERLTLTQNFLFGQSVRIDQDDPALFEGYSGTIDSATVAVTKVSTITTPDTVNPMQGQRVVLGDVVRWNAGNEFTVDIVYTLDEHDFSAAKESFTVQILYRILPRPVSPPTWGPQISSVTRGTTLNKPDAPVPLQPLTGFEMRFDRAVYASAEDESERLMTDADWAQTGTYWGSVTSYFKAVVLPNFASTDNTPGAGDVAVTTLINA